MKYGIIPKLSVELRTLSPVECDYLTVSTAEDLFQNASAYLAAFINESSYSAVFRHSDKLEDEEYKLTFSCEKVYIEASADAGAFYAAVTMNNIICLGEQPDKTVIHDKPCYPHRGLMLDVCRHFFGKDEIIKVLTIMSDLKMNRFHWHLSDDQGFRIESKKFPLLNKTGSWRAHKYLGDFMVKAKGERYGGFYTADEIKEIVAFAASRNIEIIPEIDLPGHTRAILASYPLAGCGSFKTDVWSKAGISDRIICCGNQQSMHFIFELLDEVCELFPYKMFHIGGDEAIHKRWKKCPNCQSLIKEKGLQGEKELQGWFSEQIAAHLAKKGKTAVMWNDGLTANMNDDIVCQYWDIRKSKQTAKLLRAKKLIYSPTMPFYLDNRYSAIDTGKILSFCEKDNELPTEQGRVLGIEACVWTEWLNNEDMLEYALFPRLAAVAEVAWCGGEQTDSSDFAIRLQKLLEPLFGNTGYCVLDYAEKPPRFEKWRELKHTLGARGFEYKENLRNKSSKP